MSEAARTPFTEAGVPTEDFAALLDKGRRRGFLTADDLMSVLERVELSSDLLEAVKGRVLAEGITLIDEEEPDDLGDLEALAEAARRERDNGLSDAVLPSPDEVAAAGAASGGGSGSGTGTATATATATAPNRARETRIDDDTRLTGATSDHVRMYLKEIGKVPLPS